MSNKISNDGLLCDVIGGAGKMIGEKTCDLDNFIDRSNSENCASGAASCENPKHKQKQG